LVLIDTHGLRQGTIKKLIAREHAVPVFIIGKSGFAPIDVAGRFDPSLSMSVIFEALHLYRNESGKVPAGLTAREAVLLAHLSRGACNKTIARQTGEPLPRIKYALSSIYRKMGVANRTQAALAARDIQL
jgi:DNA-binding NarL/FixJ family response regulator